MSALIWPAKKPSYFIYKPSQSPSQQQSSLPLGRIVNSLQLVYYKYLLHTGLYMLSWREQMTINSIALISIALSIYWIICAL